MTDVLERSIISDSTVETYGAQTLYARFAPIYDPIFKTFLAPGQKAAVAAASALDGADPRHRRWNRSRIADVPPQRSNLRRRPF